MNDNTDSDWGYGPDDESRTDSEIREFQRAGELVLGAGDEIDDLQASGEWIATDSPVDREVVR